MSKLLSLYVCFKNRYKTPYQQFRIFAQRQRYFVLIKLDISNLKSLLGLLKRTCPGNWISFKMRWDFCTKTFIVWSIGKVLKQPNFYIRDIHKLPWQHFEDFWPPPPPSLPTVLHNYLANPRPPCLSSWFTDAPYFVLCSLELPIH